MATTTNFGWTTPDDTDLVKDGAAAIRTLGSSVDTSFVDLLGGTTGQLLAKASGTDLDFTWSAPAVVGGITLITSTDMAGVADVTFSTISGSYKDLVVIVKNYYQAAAARLKIELNSNSTANNYDFTITSGRTAGSLTTYSNENLLQDLTTQNSDADNFMYLYFPDYTNTISRKQIQNHAGFLTDNGTVGTQFGTHQFRNTAAIDTIKILSTSAGNFTTGTCQLYGVN
jgi:hypothetical protein